MKKVAVNLYSISNNKDIIEAIKYYSLSNDLFNFTLYTNDFSLNYLFKGLSNKIKVINLDDASTFSYKLLLEEKYDLYITFESSEEIKNQLSKLNIFEKDYIISSLIKPKDSFTIISAVDINSFNDDKNIFNTKLNNLLNTVKQFKPNKSVAFSYLEIPNYVNTEFDNYLKTFDEYKGISTPSKILSTDSDIFLVETRTLDTIIESFKAFKAQKESKNKTIAQYFAKMTFQYNKKIDISLNDFFFENKLYLNVPFKILNLSSNLNSTAIIFLLKNLETII